MYEAASWVEAMSLVEQDPSTLAGVLTAYELSEWEIVGVNLDLLGAGS